MEAPRTPPAEIDEEMERVMMGREEVAPPAAHEHPAAGKPFGEEWRHHGTTLFPYQTWASDLVGERSDTKCNPEFKHAHHSLVPVSRKNHGSH